MTFRRLVSLLGLALVAFPACSPSSNESSEAAKPSIEASPPSTLVVETKAVETPAPSASEPPAATKKPSPFDGLTVEQISSIQKSRELFEPVATAGKQIFNDLKEDERFAVAVMTLSQAKLSLNQEAEKRLRTVLGDVQKANDMVARYVDEVRVRWPVTTVLNPETSQFDSKSLAVETLTELYEKAIDAGVEFPQSIRAALGQLIRSNVPVSPQGTVVLDKVVLELRPMLLEQAVTGDLLLLLAKAVRERGDVVRQHRDWTLSLSRLVDAMPREYQLEYLNRVAWSPEKEREYLAAKEKLKTEGIPSRAVFSPEGQAAYKKELEEIAVVKRKELVALEQNRRDFIEGHFRDIDIKGWQAVLALDTLFSELQGVLDVVSPDLGYRLQPLLPPDFPRDDTNVLPKLSLPGKAEDGVPIVKVDGLEIAFLIPGQPRFKDVVKLGQVFHGTMRFDAKRAPESKPEDPAILPELVYENVEMVLKSLDHRRDFEGILTFTKPGATKAETHKFSCREIRDETLEFTVFVNPANEKKYKIEFVGKVENGFVTGPVYTETSDGTVQTGKFSFKPEK